MSPPSSHPDPVVADRHLGIIDRVRDAQLANARESTADLPMLASTMFRAAACEHVLGRRGAARSSLALGLEASLAMLEGAASPGEPLRYSLLGQLVEGVSHLGPGDAHAGIWRQTFNAATLLRDAEALDRLAAVPLSLPLGSTARPEGYLAQWLIVLHTFLTEHRFDGDRMLAALEGTEPSDLAPDLVDFTLAVDVPEMELAWRIALGDADAARRALAGGLTAHERFWSRSEEDLLPDGFVAWRLSTWKVIGSGRGLALPTHSRYVFQ